VVAATHLSAILDGIPPAFSANAYVLAKVVKLGEVEAENM